MAAMPIAVSVAVAQPPVPLTTDVFSRILWIEGGAQYLWRGMDRGDVGLGIGGALSWGEPGANTTRVNLVGEGRTAATQRSDVSDLARIGATVVRQISEDGSWIWVGADAFALPGAADSKLTAEVSSGLRLRIPWFPERRPALLLEGYRDLSRYDATYARGALQFDYKFSVRNGAFVEIGQAWSSFPGGIATGSTDFERHGTDATLTFVRQEDPATTGNVTRSLELFARGLWITNNADPNILDAGVRVVWVY